MGQPYPTCSLGALGVGLSTTLGLRGSAAFGDSSFSSCFMSTAGFAMFAERIMSTDAYPIVAIYTEKDRLLLYRNILA